MVFLSAVFVMINSITEKDYVKKLSSFIRKAAIFITGMLITIFLRDNRDTGLRHEIGRRHTDEYCEIFHRQLRSYRRRICSRFPDMVISCIGLIKNAVGVAGIIMIVSLLALPVIKLMSICIVYKITAIVCLAHRVIQYLGQSE